MELLISIFENSSAKGSFRWNKISYEILQLSADSRYLQSGPLKGSSCVTNRVIGLPLFYLLVLVLVTFLERLFNL